MEIRPLSDAAGAEIIGADLSKPLDDDSFAQIHRAWLDNCVIVLRDQELPPEQHIAFSRRFGPLTKHVFDQFLLPGHPEIIRISNKKSESGDNIGLADAGRYWHSDLSYAQYPSKGSMLYALEIPPEGEGGDTLFANMYKAYDALPQDLKDAVEGKRAVFIAGRNNAQRPFKKLLSQAQRDKTPATAHPIVRTHPETGRKLIFANPQHSVAIEGMDEGKSAEILAALFEHSTQPDFVYSHVWRVGDLTFWDNRCVQHIADHTRLDDPSYIRHMHRTTIQGEILL